MPYVRGVVRDENGNLAARTVRLYERATGKLLGEKTSDAATGEYLFYVDTASEAYRVVLDDATVTPILNDLGARVLPGTPAAFLPPWESGAVDGVFEYAARVFVPEAEPASISVVGGQYTPLNTSKWDTAVLAPNGKIYSAPRESAFGVLVMDLATEESYTIALGAVAGTSLWMHAALGLDGKVYAPPFSADSVLIIDPATDAVSFSPAVPRPQEAAQRGGVFAPDGRLYSPPYKDDYILSYDPAAQRFYAFGNEIAASTDYRYNGFSLAPNKKMYAAPNRASSILEFDPVSKRVATFGDLSTATNKWTKAAVAPNGALYAAPYSPGNPVLKFDPVSGTVTTIAAPNAAWSTPVLGPNGKLYAAPYQDTTFFLEIDPMTDTLREFGYFDDSSTTAYFYKSGVMSPSGDIFFVPSRASRYLKLSFSKSPAEPLSYDFLCSIYIA